MPCCAYLKCTTPRERSDGIRNEELIQAAAAVATFLAVLVALFQEKTKDYFNRARLKATIPHVPPHSHKIMATSGAALLYVRILVEHKGGDPAENVEVMLTQCWEYGDAGRVPRSSFLPLNLSWSHFQPRQHTIRVPVGLFRHCDLGYLVQQENTVAFRFDTIVQPNTVGDDRSLPNVVGPGRYEIEVQISGDNTRTTKDRWILEIDGEWDSSEERMLSEHLRITRA